jgi:tRNA (guanine-N7-)-methyltransferase
MGKKRKLQQFAEISTFKNCHEANYQMLMAKGFDMKGKWNELFFKNDAPLVLELGCGKGEYTVELAQTYPDKNYIGIDRKGARIWRGAKTAVENNLSNVAFIRGQIQQIEYYFDFQEIEQIWITFPDPQLQSPRIRKRLTHPVMLQHYKNILRPNHLIHLKTDDDTFFQYTLDIIEEHHHQLLFATHDLYNDNHYDEISEAISIQTFYEKMWLKEEKTLNI